MITGMDFVSIPVADMTRARAFYEGALGLSPTTVNENVGTEYVLPDESTLALSDVRTLGLVFAPAMGLCLRVDDVAIAGKELESKGVKLVWGPDPYDSGYCKTVAFFDTEGNMVSVHGRYQPET